MSMVVYYVFENWIYFFGGIGEFELERFVICFVEFFILDIIYIDMKIKCVGIIGII